MNLKIKAVGIVAAFALVLGAAAPASAATTSELIDLLVSLGIISADQVDTVNAAIGGSEGGSSSSACAIQDAPDMTVGATGADVTELQQFLVAEGYLEMPAGVSYGYFGELTKEALASYQAANGITPAVGYFGPITRSSIPCEPVEVDDDADEDEDEDSSSDLQGGAGSIDDADFISSINNEEVGEGEEDVEVLGLEVEADDNSDLRLLSLKVLFENKHDHDAASSDDFDDYATEVSVWLDGEKIGEADVDDFSENDDVWSDTITLDSDAIIEADDEEDLVIAVSAVNNIDSVDLEEQWSAEVDSVRFQDAQGAIITDTTGDIGTERNFTFESFTTAQDVEMNISLSDEDGINDARVIEVSDTSETDNVEVLSFEVEVDGGSDLLIDDMVIDFTTDEDDITDVVSSTNLLLDGDEVGSESFTTNDDDGDSDASTQEVTYDDLDLTLDPGTHVFTVTVDFEEIDGDFLEGTTILAEIDDDNTDDWDVEDESGDDLADDEKKGTANADTHEARSVGIMIDVLSVTESKTVSCDGSCGSGEAEQAQFKYEFDVTAFGGDIFIDDVIEASGNDSHTYVTAAGGSIASAMNIPAADDAPVNSTWQIDEDETVTAVITINYTADAAEFVSFDLDQIQWSATDVAEDSGDSEVYDFDMDEFESDSIYLNWSA